MNTLKEEGLVLLCLSAWIERLNPEYEVWIPYVALVLLALGKAGKEPPLRAFLADQLCEPEQNPSAAEERVVARTNVWWGVARFLGFTIAIILLARVSEWKYIFVVAAVVMGVAYLLFWSGIAFYHCEKPTGSPLASVFGVFKAAIWKRHLKYPDKTTDYFNNESNQLLLLPCVPFFRWLDKAAIVESSSVSPEEQKNKGKLYSVFQVKEVKSLIKMVPMWTTFLVYRLVEVTGSTFFLEQTSHLSPQIHNGLINFLILFIIALFQSLPRFFTSYVYELLIPKGWSDAKRRRAVLVRIGVGMACSIFCCIAACLVEVHRLKLIERNNLEQDVTETPISMSIFWLVPQFFLMGLMEGLAEDGLGDFFSDHVTSMAIYGPQINECALGIGKFVSILCVYVFKSWFGETINTSHLDKYYRMLAWLSLWNLSFYWSVSTIYAQKEAQGGGVELGQILVDDVTASATNFTSNDHDTKSYSRFLTWPFSVRSLQRRSSGRVVGGGSEALQSNTF